MTTEQMLAFTHKHRLRTPRGPWRATDFLSLSPIYFSSLEELSAKTATYKQRSRNKNRRELEESQDNSQANRGYVKTNLASRICAEILPNFVNDSSASCGVTASLTVGNWHCQNLPLAECLKVRRRFYL
jgi:hypothetical protein